VRLRGLTGAAAALTVALLLANGAQAACPAVRLTPSGGVATAASARPIDLEALARLRDIKGFAPSPDGRQLFVVVQSGDPTANTYDTRWILIAADCGGDAREIDRVGHPVRYRYYGQVHGFVPVEAPVWSPDGRWVAYRKETADQPELWVADVQAGTARRVDDGAADVERVQWSTPGTLLYRTGLDRAAWRRTVADERRLGFRYDERFYVGSGELEPMTPDCDAGTRAPVCTPALRAVDVASAAAPRPATPGEAQGWDAGSSPGAARAPKGARFIAARGGDLAWAENLDPAAFKGPAPPRRVATDAAGAQPCSDPACAGYVEGVWWAPDGRSVIFLRRSSSLARPDDTPRDITSVHRWDLRTGRVTALARTLDALETCAPSHLRLLCVLETSRKPGRIVSIRLDGHAPQIVLDPNPGLEAGDGIRLDRVTYTDDMGYAGYYFVVRRRDLAPDKRHPVVVVQYQARGFLRGGTGDEYPVYPLAEQGFVVVAFNQAMNSLQTRGPMPASVEIPERAARVRSISSAIDKLVSDGVADPRRVGITGLSSGAENLHYALQRTDRFAAAIASSGPVELDFLVVTPSVYSDYKRKYETTRVVDPDGPLRTLAWGAQPQKLVTPMLVNVSRREFLMGVQGFAALRDAGRPVEVRVFPDTGRHQKYDPANRLAVYRLNLAWLAYWLQGRTPAEPDLAVQAARWERLRAPSKSAAAEAP